MPLWFQSKERADSIIATAGAKITKKLKKTEVIVKNLNKGFIQIK